MTIQVPAWAAKYDDPDVQLGAHINAMRAMKMCSQAQLGEAVGVTQGSMSRKLRGEVGISFGELLALARFFEVSLEDLIPPRYAGERVIGTEKWAPWDSNPQPAVYGYSPLTSMNVAA